MQRHVLLNRQEVELATLWLLVQQHGGYAKVRVTHQSNFGQTACPDTKIFFLQCFSTKLC